MAYQRSIKSPDGATHTKAHIEVRRIKAIYPEGLVAEVDVYHSKTAFLNGDGPCGRNVVVRIDRKQCKQIDAHVAPGFIAALANLKHGVQKALPLLQQRAENGGEGKLMWLSDNLATATEVDDLYADWTPDEPIVEAKA